MVTTYGAASLRRMTVWADEVADDAELTASRSRGGPGVTDETLGDLIATLGSIDDDEIDWQNVRQTTVLIQQSFRYEYPGPIAELRQRLMVVPPDYHDDQRLLTHKLRVSGCDVDTERSYDTFGNVVLDLSLEHVERERRRSRPGSSSSARRPSTARTRPTRLPRPALRRAVAADAARRRAARGGRRAARRPALDGRSSWRSGSAAASTSTSSTAGA